MKSRSACDDNGHIEHIRGGLSSDSYGAKWILVHDAVGVRAVLRVRRTFVNATEIGTEARRKPLARIIQHTRGASLSLSYNIALASLTSTERIRSVTKSSVTSNLCAIHSLSGELSRLETVL